MVKFARTLLVAAGLMASVAGTAAPFNSAWANEGHGPELLKPKFSWDGLFGQYDKASLKRGFEVFHQVCSNCHGLRLVAYRSLADVGLTADEIKAVAAERELPDQPNDEGIVGKRPGRASDKYIPPFPNDKAAAAANGGAAPPDLSLMAKARVGGPNYIYSLLQGFEETPPEGVTLPDGKYYNKYFPGHAISMPPQLMDDLVTYSDGTKATVAQEATDITTFLNWAAEPELDARKSMGIKVLVFVGVLTALLYALKRQVWKDVH